MCYLSSTNLVLNFKIWKSFDVFQFGLGVGLVVFISQGRRTSIPKMIWIHIFVWYDVRCGSKHLHQKDMFSKEIG